MFSGKSSLSIKYKNVECLHISNEEYDIEISFSEDSNTYYQSMDFNNSRYKEVWKRIE